MWGLGSEGYSKGLGFEGLGFKVSVPKLQG